MTGFKPLNKILLPAIAGLFYVTALWLHPRSEPPVITVDKQESATNFNQYFYRFLSLGNKRTFSNVLWIQTLLESDLEKYQKRDLSNWMYLRFLTISQLDPLFYENYLFGGIFLSVIKDDLLGAEDMFSRGLKFYPYDYSLNYYAGFNAFYEMGDYDKGFDYLSRIKDHPKAPATLKMVVNKLQFEVTQDYDLGLALLKESYDNAKDEIVKNKLYADMYSLMAERDLKCLNEGQKNCRVIDLDGRPYIKNKNGKWDAVVRFKEYKIHRKKK